MKELKQFLIENKNWTKIFAQSNDDHIKSLENCLIKETDFLPRNVKNSQRGWHIVNDIYKIPLCKHCQLNFVKFGIVGKQYSRKRRSLL